MHDEKNGTIIRCYLSFNKRFYFEVIIPEDKFIPIVQFRKLNGTNSDWSIKQIEDSEDYINDKEGLKQTILKNNFSFEAKDINEKSNLQYFQSQHELFADNKETYIKLTPEVINNVYKHTIEFSRSLTDEEFISMFLYDEKFRNNVINSFDNPADAIKFESKLKEKIFIYDLAQKIDILKLFLLSSDYNV